MIGVRKNVRKAQSVDLDFIKLHGAGNDFVFIEDFSCDIELRPDQVAWLCDRHFGIGADGIILVRSPENPSCAAYMHYINSDGSLAEMCGNGVRCFAKFLVDRGYVSAESGQLVAETRAGERRISFETDDFGKLTQATVDMGIPEFSPSAIPTLLEANAETESGTSYVREASLESPWGWFSFTCVSMGNPHAVCFLDDMDGLPDELFSDSRDKSLETFDIERAGAFFEASPVFPERANIEFAVVGSHALTMRVFERGCGETLACGTGACATHVAAALTGRAGRSNELVLRGGTLSIEWCADGHVLMTGPARESFSGTIHLPA